MRNRFIAGLFATAVLILAPPVAAEEQISQSRSLNVGIEEIQAMIQRSQERQGVFLTGEEDAHKDSGRNVEAVVQELAPTITTAPTTQPVSAPVAAKPQIKVVPESTTVFEPSKSKTVFQPNTVFSPGKNSATTTDTSTVPSTTETAPSYITEPKISPQSKVVPQQSQQVAVRHSRIQRHQREETDPEPSRKEQISNRAFMLFTADLAWNRVDETSDKSIHNPYSLGARLERGVITPLAALRVYAPHRVAEGLAILRGEKEYT
jgi:hypothetical protein